MRRLAVPSLVFSVLAACAAERGAEDAASPVAAYFSEQAVDVIEVRVADRQPVDKVELFAPDGRIFLAHRIDREKEAAGGGARPSFGLGVGVFGGSSTRVGTSIGLGFPLGGIEQPYREPGYTSLAAVRVSDMAAYRADWQRWVLRIRLGTPETSFRFMEIPAPRPPEG